MILVCEIILAIIGLGIWAFLVSNYQKNKKSGYQPEDGPKPLPPNSEHPKSEYWHKRNHQQQKFDWEILEMYKNNLEFAEEALDYAIYRNVTRDVKYFNTRIQYLKGKISKIVKRRGFN
ncbi:MAG: hypothetical protein P4L79_10045 [Legionella sp.]|uniref:hypothetical protein n=1 Tax=Legionella sp. TaxID=459 RepID=UPI00283C98B2|nr:hypothetical protein [Legionella sp.]